jgi:hypothetical protein
VGISPSLSYGIKSFQNPSKGWQAASKCAGREFSFVASRRTYAGDKNPFFPSFQRLINLPGGREGEREKPLSSSLRSLALFSPLVPEFSCIKVI